jgi:hypothetical protein
MYYGLLMFAQAFPPGAQLLPVTVPGGPVKVWATRAPDGRTRVVVINKDRSSPVVVSLDLPGPQTPASTESLTAPGVRATSGVGIGGQSFGTETRTGRLAGPPRLGSVVPGAGIYSVRLPAASALLLTR